MKSIGKKILVIVIGVGVFAGLYFVASNLNLFDQETKLEKKLEEIGVDFYTNFYYEQISSNKTEQEVQEFLEKYIETGINVDIDNLSRFNEEKYPNLLDEFTNKKDNIACDIRNTKAIIYPKSPYTVEDYKVSAKLDCGFEK